MKPENLIGRTNQKLNFAQIHLDELKAMPPSLGRGSDFERAHHEAFFAQLFGAYYAFLSELNQYLACGLTEDQVYLQALVDALNKQKKTSSILTELTKRIRDKDNEADWLLILEKMRHHTTHISGIPLAYHMSGKTALIHPVTKKEQKDDLFDAFSSWLTEMEQLIDRLRKKAISGEQ